MNHTPGKWRLDSYDRGHWIIEALDENGEGYRLAFIDKDKGETWEQEAEANARLIAAAPQLLEACAILVRAEFPEDDNFSEIFADDVVYDAWVKAKTAIAQAKGEADEK